MEDQHLSGIDYRTYGYDDEEDETEEPEENEDE